MKSQGKCEDIFAKRKLLVYNIGEVYGYARNIYERSTERG